MWIAHHPPLGVDDARTGPIARVVMDCGVIYNDTCTRWQRIGGIANGKCLLSGRLACYGKNNGEDSHDFVLNMDMSDWEAQ